VADGRQIGRGRQILDVDEVAAQPVRIRMLPREIPLIAPMITPTNTAISIATTPTASEIRPP